MKRLPKELREPWQRAICFIARNDEPNDFEFSNIRGYVSTICVAETFFGDDGAGPEYVARAVLKLRRKESACWDCRGPLSRKVYKTGMAGFLLCKGCHRARNATLKTQLEAFAMRRRAGE